MDPVREANRNLLISNLNRDISELSIKKKYCVGLAVAATTICVAALAVGVFALLAILVPPIGVPVAFGAALGSIVLIGIFISCIGGISSERYRKREELEALQQLMAQEATSRVTTPPVILENSTAGIYETEVIDSVSMPMSSSKVLECAITLEKPVDPVFFNGRLYDRQPLRIWLNNRDKDPLTNLKVLNKQFYTFKTAKELEPKCPITHKSFEKPYFSQETGYCYELTAIEALSFAERRELLNVHDKKSITLYFWYDLEGEVEKGKESVTLQLI